MDTPYDTQTDYASLMEKAAASGDYTSAARYEKLRNAKIKGEGLDYETSDYYSKYLPENRYAYDPSKNDVYQRANDQATAIYDKIMNRGEFTFDLNKDMLKQSFVEGSEEVCTDIANVISDAIVMADKSEINQTIAAYQAGGMSEDEATRRAWLDWLGQTAQDFAGGAISGGVMTGGDMALNAGMRSANYRETGRQITASDYADILRHAAEESGDENLRKLAGKKQTNRNTGKLYEATQEANLTQAVSDRLGALGTPENDVQELTGLVVKQIKGQELTRKEQRKFDASKQAQRAASEYASLFTRDADRTTNAWARSHMRDAAELERNAIYGGARKADAGQTQAHQAEKNAEVQVNGETAQVQALRYDQESGSVELSVKGKNGDVQRVSVKDAKLPEGTRLLAESAEKYGETAPQMYANYQNGQDVERYASAYEVAYSYGRAGVKNYAVLENSGAASYLTPEQRKFAYETGLAAARRESDAKSAAAKSGEIQAGSVTLEGGKLGNVTLAAVNTAGLTRKQTASIDVARKVAEATGVNVVFFESQTGEDGKYLGMNGAYRDGTIYLDVNAGKNSVGIGETAILKTMAHELTHFIQQNSGQYEALKAFVANHVLESGDSIERLARQKLDNDSTGELTMDGAMDEVVADACEMMLRNTEAVQRLANENRSLAEKIRDWIGDFVKKLRAAFKGDRATHDEARAMLDRMVELQKLWDDALVDAAKTRAAKENTAGDGGVQEQARQAYENKNLAEDSEVYNYGFLTSLPDMRITRLPEVPMIRDTGGKVNSAVVITEGMKNARSVGGERDGKIYVQNAYTGRQLRIDTSSIRHGLNGGVNRLITNARLGAVIGDVVQNAVPVNALYNKAKDVMGTYAMAAYANDSRNREFVAIVTVEQRSGNISGLESYDVTHAVSGRQKNSSQADTKSQGVYPIKAAKISIADFLSIVNSTHQSILSDDVLQHFRESRNPNGDYSGRVKFSERERDDVVSQEITSEKTSIKQVAGLFKDKNAKFGKTNIDVGGGRFNLVTDYLAERGTKNMVFDPYNRGVDENTATLRYLQNGGRADTATCANVLNVIREPDARANVILEVAKCIRDGGTAYFTVYEGDGSGEGRQTSCGWQNNRKTVDYVSEIGRYFDDVERKGKLIIAANPKQNLPKASWEVEPGRGVQFSLREFEDGRKFVDVAAEQERFDHLSANEQQKAAKKAIQEKFVGKVIGLTNRAFVNGNTAKEYAFPSKSIKDPNAREAKMRASTELDNLLEAGENFRTEPDGRDGHVHPNATGDFRYFDTLFKVGNEYYTGVINVMPVNKGLLLKDITKIRNVTKDITGSYGENPQSRFLRDASMNSIRSSGGNSQEKSGESALYQRRDDTRTDRDVLSDAADGDAANVREMEMLREYREKLQKYSSLTRRLEHQRELAQNAESKEERLKARNRADNLAAQVSRADAQLTRMQNAKPLRELVARELKTRDSLAKENAMLRDRVEYWRGQTRRTEEATTDPKAVREAAKNIIKQTGSSIGVDEVTGRLQELYDGIARATSENGLSQEDIWKRAYDLAHDILDDVSVREDTMYREYADLRKYFKGKQLVVSAADRGEIPDFGDFRRRNMGRMRLKNGERTNVDQVYAELSELYPEFFDQNRESQPSDQLYRIADVLDAVYSVNDYNPNAQYIRVRSGAADHLGEEPEVRRGYQGRRHHHQQLC